MSVQELVQRRITKAFIGQAPVKIKPAGMTGQADGTGGTTMVKDTGFRRELTVTLVEPSDSGSRLPSYNGQGFSTALQFVVIAEWDGDIRDDDRFTVDGHEFRVERMLVENGYERRALVTRID